VERKDIARRFAGEIVAKYPKDIKSVILFGSVAEGKDTKESDIDLLVLTKKEIKGLDWALSELTTDYILRYGEVPIALSYQEVDFKAKASQYMFNKEVLEKGQYIYGS